MIITEPNDQPDAGAARVSVEEALSLDRTSTRLLTRTAIELDAAPADFAARFPGPSADGAAAANALQVAMAAQAFAIGYRGAPGRRGSRESRACDRHGRRGSTCRRRTSVGRPDARAPAFVMTDGSTPEVTSGLYFELRVDHAHRRIAVCGGVDIACAPNVATAVARLQRAAPGDITVALDQVTFIDMSGLGVLVGARAAQADRGDQLIIMRANPQVRRVFGFGSLTYLLDPSSAVA